MRKGLLILSASLLALLLLPMQLGPLQRGLGVLLLLAAGLLFLVRERRRAEDRAGLESSRARAETELARAAADADNLREQTALLTRQLDDALESRHLIIDGFPDPAVFVGRDFSVSFMNKAARERFGAAADSGKAQSCYRLIHGREEPCDPATRPCALTTGTSCKEIQSVVEPDGQERLVELRLTPLRNQRGEVSGAVEVIHDLTTQEALELKLKRARADAEIARRARSEFVSTLSHEVRTPMNAVLGMADLLGRTKLNRKQASYLGVIQSSGNLLLSLVENLLGTNELDAGRLRLRQEAFSVPLMLESVLEIMGYQAYSRGIELAGCLKDNQVTWVSGDRPRLIQVLINLISNAIRFTARGEVIVKAAARRGRTGEAHLSVSVTDTGTGIPEAALATIFRPFSRMDEEQVRGGLQGSGVGLSISKQLVELMGGQLTLTSESGKGTTASFTVPMAPAERPGRIPEADDAVFSSHRILVVDDNANVGTVLCDCLTGQGADCRLTTDHDEVESLLGAASAAGTPYDCVVVDAGLGRRRGLHLARRLRAREETHALPIVLLASIAHPLEPGEISALGHTRCVTKPVRISEIRKSLVRLLEVADAPAVDAEASSHDDRSLAVLVAEDNPISRRILAGMLESLGQRVEAVEDGPSVLEALEARHYDVILMDCQMPGLDGDEVTRRIRSRADSGSPPPRIVAVSADVSAEHRERCLEAGMDEFIAKPVRLEALREGLVRWRARVGERPGRPTDGAAFLARLSERAGGNDSGALKVYIDLFLSDTAARLQRLQAALDRGDFDAVRRECHAMKGACMELGVPEMTDCCEVLGAASRDRQVEVLPDALRQLSQEFEKVRGVFESEKSRLA